MKWSYPDGNKANHTSEPLFWSCVSRWEIVMHVFWQPVWTLSWLTTTANEWLKRRGETTSCLIFRARSEWVKNLPSSAQCRKQIRKRLTGASRVLPDVVRPFKNSKGGWLTCHTPPKANSSPWKMMVLKDNCMVPSLGDMPAFLGGVLQPPLKLKYLLHDSLNHRPDRPPKQKRHFFVVASETAAVGLQTWMEEEVVMKTANVHQSTPKKKVSWW